MAKRLGADTIMQGIKDKFPHLPEKISGLKRAGLQPLAELAPRRPGALQAPQSPGLASEQPQPGKDDQQQMVNTKNNNMSGKTNATKDRTKVVH
jgi:hypothetical protein